MAHPQNPLVAKEKTHKKSKTKHPPAEEDNPAEEPPKQKASTKQKNRVAAQVEAAKLKASKKKKKSEDAAPVEATSANKQKSNKSKSAKQNASKLKNSHADQEPRVNTSKVGAPGKKKKDKTSSGDLSALPVPVSSKRKADKYDRDYVLSAEGAIQRERNATIAKPKHCSVSGKKGAVTNADRWAALRITVEEEQILKVS